MTPASFGRLADGTDVGLFTLSNARGLEVRAIAYGAILVSVRVPDRRGRLDDVVLGFDDLEGYRAWLAAMTSGDDPLLHAIVDGATGSAVGVAAFMRIEPAVGVIEVGNLNFSPLLQRTRLATEAMFLMMRRVFDELGYRRYEWKCDSLNVPSRRAAERLGFSFEGIFRQAVVYKGRNRDTAWFSILDREWPKLRGAYEQWLSPANFDDSGRQRRRLADLIEHARADHSGG